VIFNKPLVVRLMNMHQAWCDADVVLMGAVLAERGTAWFTPARFVEGSPDKASIRGCIQRLRELQMVQLSATRCSCMAICESVY